MQPRICLVIQPGQQWIEAWLVDLDDGVKSQVGGGYTVDEACQSAAQRLGRPVMLELKPGEP